MKLVTRRKNTNKMSATAGLLVAAIPKISPTPDTTLPTSQQKRSSITSCDLTKAQVNGITELSCRISRSSSQQNIETDSGKSSCSPGLLDYSYEHSIGMGANGAAHSAANARAGLAEGTLREERLCATNSNSENAVSDSVSTVSSIGIGTGISCNVEEQMRQKLRYDRLHKFRLILLALDRQRDPHRLLRERLSFHIMRQQMQVVEFPSNSKCNNLLAGISAVVGVIGGVCLLTSATKTLIDKIGERRFFRRGSKNENNCNVCSGQIKQVDSNSFVTCYLCNRRVCRGANCSIWLAKSGQWECQICNSSKDSLTHTQTWVAEQMSFNHQKFVSPLRTRSEIYIPIGDFNESSIHFESVSQVGLNLDVIPAEQKLKIREYVEEVVAKLLGCSLDQIRVNQLSKSETYLQLFERYHSKLSNIFINLENELSNKALNEDLPGIINSNATNQSAAILNNNQSSHNPNVSMPSEFSEISQTRLRQMIESIIAETLRMPPLGNGSVSEVALNMGTRSNGVAKSLPLGNGNARLPHHHRTEHYFEPKIYQDLLATAVLNKIADKEGNIRQFSESTPDLSSCNIDSNFNVENQSTSSGSSVEPRSDFSYTDTEKSPKINKVPGRESVLSDYIAVHTVPLPDLSAAVTESEDDVDHASISSSILAEGTWEDNWLFKKRRSSLTASITGSVGMLVPAPKDDIRAQIGDKTTDEISDLSEMGSDTDDSSSKIICAKIDPLNDRILNKHLIGGQNTKVVLDELIETASMISNTSQTLNEPKYTETRNEHAVEAASKVEALNPSIVNNSAQETMLGYSDTEREQNPSPAPSQSSEDIQYEEGCTGFSTVETFEPTPSEHNPRPINQGPSVIEILAAMTLGPMLAVPASEQPPILTPTELSSLKELSDLALAKIKARTPEMGQHSLDIIDEEEETKVILLAENNKPNTDEDKSANVNIVKASETPATDTKAVLQLLTADDEAYKLKAMAVTEPRPIDNVNQEIEVDPKSPELLTTAKKPTTALPSQLAVNTLKISEPSLSLETESTTKVNAESTVTASIAGKQELVDSETAVDETVLANPIKIIDMDVNAVMEGAMSSKPTQTDNPKQKEEEIFKEPLNIEEKSTATVIPEELVTLKTPQKCETEISAEVQHSRSGAVTVIHKQENPEFGNIVNKSMASATLQVHEAGVALQDGQVKAKEAVPIVVEEMVPDIERNTTIGDAHSILEGTTSIQIPHPLEIKAENVETFKAGQLDSAHVAEMVINSVAAESPGLVYTLLMMAQDKAQNVQAKGNSQTRTTKAFEIVKINNTDGQKEGSSQLSSLETFNPKPDLVAEASINFTGAQVDGIHQTIETFQPEICTESKKDSCVSEGVESVTSVGTDISSDTILFAKESKPLLTTDVEAVPNINEIISPDSTTQEIPIESETMPRHEVDPVQVVNKKITPETIIGEVLTESAPLLTSEIEPVPPVKTEITKTYFQEIIAEPRSLRTNEVEPEPLDHTKTPGETIAPKILPEYDPSQFDKTTTQTMNQEFHIATSAKISIKAPLQEVLTDEAETGSAAPEKLPSDEILKTPTSDILPEPSVQEFPYALLELSQTNELEQVSVIDEFKTSAQKIQKAPTESQPIIPTDENSMVVLNENIETNKVEAGPVFLENLPPTAIEEDNFTESENTQIYEVEPVPVNHNNFQENSIKSEPMGMVAIRQEYDMCDIVNEELSSDKTFQIPKEIIEEIPTEISPSNTCEVETIPNVSTKIIAQEVAMESKTPYEILQNAPSESLTPQADEQASESMPSANVTVASAEFATKPSAEEGFTKIASLPREDSDVVPFVNMDTPPKTIIEEILNKSELPGIVEIEPVPATNSAKLLKPITQMISLEKSLKSSTGVDPVPLAEAGILSDPNLHEPPVETKRSATDDEAPVPANSDMPSNSLIPSESTPIKNNEGDTVWDVEEHTKSDLICQKPRIQLELPQPIEPAQEKIIQKILNESKPVPVINDDIPTDKVLQVNSKNSEPHHTVEEDTLPEISAEIKSAKSTQSKYMDTERSRTDDEELGPFVEEKLQSDKNPTEMEEVLDISEKILLPTIIHKILTEPKPTLPVEPVSDISAGILTKTTAQEALLESTPPQVDEGEATPVVAAEILGTAEQIVAELEPLQIDEKEPVPLTHTTDDMPFDKISQENFMKTVELISVREVNEETQPGTIQINSMTSECSLTDEGHAPPIVTEELTSNKIIQLSTVLSNPVITETRSESNLPQTVEIEAMPIVPMGKSPKLIFQEVVTESAPSQKDQVEAVSAADADLTSYNILQNLPTDGRQTSKLFANAEVESETFLKQNTMLSAEVDTVAVLTAELPIEISAQEILTEIKPVPTGEADEVKFCNVEIPPKTIIQEIFTESEPPWRDDIEKEPVNNLEIPPNPIAQEILSEGKLLHAYEVGSLAESDILSEPSIQELPAQPELSHTDEVEPLPIVIEGIPSNTIIQEISGESEAWNIDELDLVKIINSDMASDSLVDPSTAPMQNNEEDTISAVEVLLNADSMRQAIRSQLELPQPIKPAQESVVDECQPSKEIILEIPKESKPCKVLHPTEISTQNSARETERPQTYDEEPGTVGPEELESDTNLQIPVPEMKESLNVIAKIRPNAIIHQIPINEIKSTSLVHKVGRESKPLLADEKVSVSVVNAEVASSQNIPKISSESLASTPQIKEGGAVLISAENHLNTFLKEISSEAGPMKIGEVKPVPVIHEDILCNKIFRENIKKSELMDAIEVKPAQGISETLTSDKSFHIPTPKINSILQSNAEMSSIQNIEKTTTESKPLQPAEEEATPIILTDEMPKSIIQEFPAELKAPQTDQEVLVPAIKQGTPLSPAIQENTPQSEAVPAAEEKPLPDVSTDILSERIVQEVAPELTSPLINGMTAVSVAAEEILPYKSTEKILTESLQLRIDAVEPVAVIYDSMKSEPMETVEINLVRERKIPSDNTRSLSMGSESSPSGEAETEPVATKESTSAKILQPPTVQSNPIIEDALMESTLPHTVKEETVPVVPIDELPKALIREVTTELTPSQTDKIEPVAVAQNLPTEHLANAEVETGTEPQEVVVKPKAELTAQADTVAVVTAEVAIEPSGQEVLTGIEPVPAEELMAAPFCNEEIPPKSIIQDIFTGSEPTRMDETNQEAVSNSDVTRESTPSQADKVEPVAVAQTLPTESDPSQADMRATEHLTNGEVETDKQPQEIVMKAKAVLAAQADTMAVVNAEFPKEKSAQEVLTEIEPVPADELEAVPFCNEEIPPKSIIQEVFTGSEPTRMDETKQEPVTNLEGTTESTPSQTDKVEPVAVAQNLPTESDPSQADMRAKEHLTNAEVETDKQPQEIVMKAKAVLAAQADTMAVVTAEFPIETSAQEVLTEIEPVPADELETVSFCNEEIPPKTIFQEILTGSEPTRMDETKQEPVSNLGGTTESAPSQTDKVEPVAVAQNLSTESDPSQAYMRSTEHLTNAEVETDEQPQEILMKAKAVLAAQADTMAVVTAEFPIEKSAQEILTEIEPVPAEELETVPFCNEEIPPKTIVQEILTGSEPTLMDETKQEPVTNLEGTTESTSSQTDKVEPVAVAQNLPTESDPSQADMRATEHLTNAEVETDKQPQQIVMKAKAVLAAQADTMAEVTAEFPIETSAQEVLTEIEPVPADELETVSFCNEEIPPKTIVQQILTGSEPTRMDETKQEPVTNLEGTTESTPSQTDKVEPVAVAQNLPTESDPSQADMRATEHLTNAEVETDKQPQKIVMKAKAVLAAQADTMAVVTAEFPIEKSAQEVLTEIEPVPADELETVSFCNEEIPPKTIVQEILTGSEPTRMDEIKQEPVTNLEGTTESTPSQTDKVKPVAVAQNLPTESDPSQADMRATEHLTNAEVETDKQPQEIVMKAKAVLAAQADTMAVVTAEFPIEKSAQEILTEIEPEPADELEAVPFCNEEIPPKSIIQEIFTGSEPTRMDKTKQEPVTNLEGTTESTPSQTDKVEPVAVAQNLPTESDPSQTDMRATEHLTNAEVETDRQPQEIVMKAKAVLAAQADTMAVVTAEFPIETSAQEVLTEIEPVPADELETVSFCNEEIPPKTIVQEILTGSEPTRMDETKQEPVTNLEGTTESTPSQTDKVEPVAVAQNLPTESDPSQADMRATENLTNAEVETDKQPQEIVMKAKAVLAAQADTMAVVTAEFPIEKSAQDILTEIEPVPADELEAVPFCNEEIPPKSIIQEVFTGSEPTRMDETKQEPVTNLEGTTESTPSQTDKVDPVAVAQNLPTESDPSQTDMRATEHLTNAEVETDEQPQEILMKAKAVLAAQADTMAVVTAKFPIETSAQEVLTEIEPVPADELETVSFCNEEIPPKTIVQEILTGSEPTLMDETKQEPVTNLEGTTESTPSQTDKVEPVAVAQNLPTESDPSQADMRAKEHLTNAEVETDKQPQQIVLKAKAVLAAQADTMAVVTAEFPIERSAQEVLTEIEPVPADELETVSFCNEEIPPKTIVQEILTGSEPTRMDETKQEPVSNLGGTTESTPSQTDKVEPVAVAQNLPTESDPSQADMRATEHLTNAEVETDKQPQEIVMKAKAVLAAQADTMAVVTAEFPIETSAQEVLTEIEPVPADELETVSFCNEEIPPKTIVQEILTGSEPTRMDETKQEPVSNLGGTTESTPSQTDQVEPVAVAQNLSTESDPSQADMRSTEHLTNAEVETDQQPQEIVMKAKAVLAAQADTMAVVTAEFPIEKSAQEILTEIEPVPADELETVSFCNEEIPPKTIVQEILTGSEPTLIDETKQEPVTNLEGTTESTPSQTDKVEPVAVAQNLPTESDPSQADMRATEHLTNAEVETDKQPQQIVMKAKAVLTAQADTMAVVTAEFAIEKRAQEVLTEIEPVPADELETVPFCNEEIPPKTIVQEILTGSEPTRMDETKQEPDTNLEGTTESTPSQTDKVEPVAFAQNLPTESDLSQADMRATAQLANAEVETDKQPQQIVMKAKAVLTAQADTMAVVTAEFAIETSAQEVHTEIEPVPADELETVSFCNGEIPPKTIVQEILTGSEPTRMDETKQEPVTNLEGTTESTPSQTDKVEPVAIAQNLPTESDPSQAGMRSTEHLTNAEVETDKHPQEIVMKAKAVLAAQADTMAVVTAEFPIETSAQEVLTEIEPVPTDELEAVPFCNEEIPPKTIVQEILTGSEPTRMDETKPEPVSNLGDTTESTPSQTDKVEPVAIAQNLPTESDLSQADMRATEHLTNAEVETDTQPQEIVMESKAVLTVQADTVAMVTAEFSIETSTQEVLAETKRVPADELEAVPFCNEEILPKTIIREAVSETMQINEVETLSIVSAEIPPKVISEEIFTEVPATDDKISEWNFIKSEPMNTVELVIARDIGEETHSDINQINAMGPELSPVDEVETTSIATEELASDNILHLPTLPSNPIIQEIPMEPKPPQIHEIETTPIVPTDKLPKPFVPVLPEPNAMLSAKVTIIDGELSVKTNGQGSLTEFKSSSRGEAEPVPRVNVKLPPKTVILEIFTESEYPRLEKIEQVSGPNSEIPPNSIFQEILSEEKLPQLHEVEPVPVAEADILSAPNIQELPGESEQAQIDEIGAIVVMALNRIKEEISAESETLLYSESAPSQINDESIVSIVTPIRQDIRAQLQLPQSNELGEVAVVDEGKSLQEVSTDSKQIPAIGVEAVPVTNEDMDSTKSEVNQTVQVNTDQENSAKINSKTVTQTNTTKSKPSQTNLVELTPIVTAYEPSTTIIHDIVVSTLPRADEKNTVIILEAEIPPVTTGHENPPETENELAVQVEPVSEIRAEILSKTILQELASESTSLIVEKLSTELKLMPTCEIEAGPVINEDITCATIREENSVNSEAVETATTTTTVEVKPVQDTSKNMQSNIIQINAMGSASILTENRMSDKIYKMSELKRPQTEEIGPISAVTAAESSPDIDKVKPVAVADSDLTSYKSIQNLPTESKPLISDEPASQPVPHVEVQSEHPQEIYMEPKATPSAKIETVPVAEAGLATIFQDILTNSDAMQTAVVKPMQNISKEIQSETITESYIEGSGCLKTNEVESVSINTENQIPDNILQMLTPEVQPVVGEDRKPDRMVQNIPTEIQVSQTYEIEPLSMINIGDVSTESKHIQLAKEEPVSVVNVKPPTERNIRELDSPYTGETETEVPVNMEIPPGTIIQENPTVVNEGTLSFSIPHDIPKELELTSAGEVLPVQIINVGTSSDSVLHEVTSEPNPLLIDEVEPELVVKVGITSDEKQVPVPPLEGKETGVLKSEPLVNVDTKTDVMISDGHKQSASQCSLRTIEEDNLSVNTLVTSDNIETKCTDETETMLVLVERILPNTILLQNRSECISESSPLTAVETGIPLNVFCETPHTILNPDTQTASQTDAGTPDALKKLTESQKLPDPETQTLPTVPSEEPRAVLLNNTKCVESESSSEVPNESHNSAEQNYENISATVEIENFISGFDSTTLQSHTFTSETTITGQSCSTGSIEGMSNKDVISIGNRDEGFSQARSLGPDNNSDTCGIAFADSLSLFRPMTKRLCRQSHVVDTTLSDEDCSLRYATHLASLSKTFIRDKRLLAALEKQRRQSEVMQKYLRSIDSFETDFDYEYHTQSVLPEHTLILSTPPPPLPIDDVIAETDDSLIKSLSDCKFNFLNDILFSDQLSSDSNRTDESAPTTVESYLADCNNELDLSLPNICNSTTANTTILTNGSYLSLSPSKSNSNVNQEDHFINNNSNHQQDINREDNDVIHLRYFVPGSIAEREYKKWNNAVEMPNNPYAPEALKRRISGSQERFIDLPNIVPNTEKSPISLIKADAADDSRSEIDYKRYSRDYYINDDQVSKTSPKHQIVATDGSRPSPNISDEPTADIAINEPIEPHSAVYEALPAQVVEENASIETLSNQSMQSVNTTTSDDSDTVRIYDFKNQQTTTLRNERKTPTKEITTKDSCEPTLQAAVTISTSIEDSAPNSPNAAEANCSGFNTASARTPITPTRGSTPMAFKFLQPKRKLIDPSKILSQDDGADALPNSPPGEKAVVEEEVAQVMPSVKALAQAFLFSSNKCSPAEKRWKKGVHSTPSVSHTKPGVTKKSEASLSIVEIAEDATIASDLSSLETDPPTNKDLLTTTFPDTLLSISPSTISPPAEHATNAEGNKSTTNALRRVSMLKSNIAFFENLRFK